MKPQIIKAVKGVLYFPTLDAAQGFAQHCGISNPRFACGLRGWSVVGVRS